MMNETTQVVPESSPTTSRMNPRQLLLSPFQSLARTASFTVTILLVAYIIITLLGFASLESPDDPIEDPYFTMMEVLILLIMPPMVLIFVALHEQSDKKLYTLSALAFMTACAGITSCVHFVVLTVSRQIQDEIPGSEYLMSFSWPSVVYALDILAWDWFFGLAMIIGSIPWWGETRMNKALCILMNISGILSLVGLIALPLDNIQIRIIGIVGYAAVSIPAFVLMGMLLTPTKQDSTPEARYKKDDQEESDLPCE